MTDEATKTTNPAERLLDIMQAAKKQRNDITALDAWQNIFNCHGEPDEVFFAHLVELKNLAEHVKALVSHKTDDAQYALCTRDFHQIDEIVVPYQFSQPWGNYKRYITPELTIGIEFCSTFLTDYSESVLSEEQLEELNELINELLKKIEESDFPMDFKLRVPGQIKPVQTSVKTYKLTGADGIKKAMESLTGTLAMNKNAIESAVNENGAEGKELIGTLKKLFQYVDEIMPYADKLLSFASKVKDLLG